MSANTWVNTGTAVPRPAGGTIPLCASSATSAVGLEQHRLAAGVRAADEQGALAAVHLERERDHHRRLAPAAADAARRAAAAAPPASHHLGHLTLHRDRVARAGHEVVHLDAHLQRIGEDLARRAQDRGQLAQHPQHLALLLGLRLAQRVAQLDRLGGLDEERARAGRLVVDDAAGAARESRRTGMT